MEYPIVFDGKAYAAKIEKKLSNHLFEQKKKGIFINPKLNILLIGTNDASELYVKKKMEACLRVGINCELFRVSTIQRDEKYLIKLIRHMNRDLEVNGIMVQLPLPAKYKKQTQQILDAIAPEKDVDGLGVHAQFDAATARAVLAIVSEAKKVVKLPKDPKVLVIGGKGYVGRATVKAFEKAGYDVTGADKQDEVLRSKISTKLTTSAHILVSATGVPFLIRNRNVAPHAVVIDVGSPKGDVEFEGASKRADFITPVPGGVGPVTVISLLQNVVDAAVKQHELFLEKKEL